MRPFSTARPAGQASPPSGGRGRPVPRGQAVAPFFAGGAACLVVAGLLELARSAGVPGLVAWRWPIVHLATVGGATQLIVGAMTFFATTLLMANAPPGWLMRAQWVLVNLSALGLAAGVLLGATWLGVVGGLALLGTLALLLATLGLLRRRSLARPDPTLRYYQTAIGYLIVGATLGILMLAGLTDSLVPRLSVRLAHLHLNLVGWVTLTIVGTMRLFLGTALGAPARHLNPLWAEYWPLAVGTALIATGWLVGATALFVVGSLLQGIGVGAYVVFVIRQWWPSRARASLVGAHLLAATFWLVAMTLGTLVAGALRSTDAAGAVGWTAAATTAGYLGFIGQTILGAWTHLFPVTGSLLAPRRAGNAEALRPRLRALLEAQRWPQLGLVNLGVGAVALGAAIAPSAPSLASGLETAGLAALSAALLLVGGKVSRAIGLACGVGVGSG